MFHRRNIFFYISLTLVRLFVNGTLYKQGRYRTFYASGQKAFITLGHYGTNGGGCRYGDIRPGQFFGRIDEVFVFNRDLTADDICALSNI